MLKPYQFFEKRGYDPSILSVSGMAAGLATHELLGFSWLFGSWTICYKLQPARHLASVGPWSNSETVRNWREQGKVVYIANIVVGESGTSGCVYVCVCLFVAVMRSGVYKLWCYWLN
mmetsp:Transcript_29014/g.46353  ORF Transcript_29014/g.46353 Transcript_29014/m.46353 type:complete len:117 (-) Transcript_29014:73-423(-)